ncbi:MAG: ABC transporter permease [Chlorobi bacterium]|nr:ABC transporter permease [Chlorobiota bacterium]
MNKLKAVIVKEILILSRDRAGMAMLFVMPVFLVLVMTLLQDSTFKQLDEKQLPVLIINHDADTFGLKILEGLKSSKFFKITEVENIDKQDFVQKIEKGEYLIGIIINEDATRRIRQSIQLNIQQQFPEEVGQLFEYEDNASGQARVEIIFDPILKSSYKQSILGSLKHFSAMVEARLMFEIYSGLFKDLLSIELKPTSSFDDIVNFDEKYASSGTNKIIPNSVQHNVPAWTIFAMFFIVIPLASNIIKERHSGVSARLLTIAGSKLISNLGKGMTYFVVGFIQAILMLFIGLFILPLFGLPSLQIGGNGLALLVVTIAVVMAATTYGIAIGNIATTEQQSSIFGSISVVILAAIGGVWVPSFMMSDLMLNLSKISPLNWGLNAYYDIFLRNSGLIDLLPNIALLLGFSFVCLFVSFLYSKRGLN